MFATLLARRAWNIRKSTPRINNERKCLRRCSDPNPRSVIPKRSTSIQHKNRNKMNAIEKKKRGGTPGTRKGWDRHRGACERWRWSGTPISGGGDGSGREFWKNWERKEWGVRPWRRGRGGWRNQRSRRLLTECRWSGRGKRGEGGWWWWWVESVTEPFSWLGGWRNGNGVLWENNEGKW